MTVAQVILAAGRFVVRMSVVQQVAAFFRSAEGGEGAAAGGKCNLIRA